MTDLSRRAVLSRVGVVGVAGLAAGTGTYGVLHDGEYSGLSAASGTLDLQLAATTGGGIPTGFESESGVTIGFPTFDPESSVSGQSTVALRSCTNPALAKVTVPSVPDAELADYITITLRYASDCATDEESSSIIYEGSLANIDGALGNGAPLSNVSCRDVGKLEYDESSGALGIPGGDSSTTFPYTFDFGSESITVIELVTDGSKVVGLEAESTESGLCRIDVKGGPDTVTYHPGCSDVASGLLTDFNNGGQRSGLSHVRFWVCDGERRCIPCKKPACLRVIWEYEPPRQQNTIDSLANQELEFGLEFESRQCRHDRGLTQ